MAPEVVSRKGHSIAADWWSYGVLMVLVHVLYISTYVPGFSSPLSRCALLLDSESWFSSSFFDLPEYYSLRTLYSFCVRVDNFLPKNALIAVATFIDVDSFAHTVILIKQFSFDDNEQINAAVLAVSSLLNHSHSLSYTYSLFLQGSKWTWMRDFLCFLPVTFYFAML